MQSSQTSWPGNQTQFQTKPAARKGQRQGEMSRFKGTCPVHFDGQVLGLILPGVVTAHRVLGSAPCFPVLLSF